MATFHAYITECEEPPTLLEEPSAEERNNINSTMPIETTLQLKIAPNPIQNTAQISYYLPNSEKVNLSIFDINGQVVKQLTNGWAEQGWQEMTFTNDALPSGLYLLVVQSASGVKTKKFSLVN